MNSLAFFWMIAGFMAGLAAAFFAMRVWRARSVLPLSGINGWMLAALLVFVAGAFFIYANVGHPPAGQAVGAMPVDHAQSQANDSAAGSIADATARLAAKLARGEGSDADWQLLKQSYEFLGDTAAAALAAQHKLPDGAALTATGAAADAPQFAARSVTDVAQYRKRVTDNPKDAAAWRALAENYRTSRQFKEANAAYAQLIQLKAMDADSWADYADAMASQTGSLGNAETRNALTAALKLDPGHPKSLWLQASLLVEERRYAESLKTWRQLRALIDDASPDAKIIDANIAEAESMSGSAGVAAATTRVAANAKAVQVRGSVSVDAALKDKVSGATLFVFAKTAESPMPVAVYRKAVAGWPVEFTLDDAQAVMPTRKLSDVARVIVQARLSRSGQATAQPGDWQSDAVNVSTRDGQPVSLVIRQQVAKAGS